MSILLEALRKSEKNRRPRETPTIHTDDQLEASAETLRTMPLALLMSAALLLTGWMVWKQYQPPAESYQPPVTLQPGEVTVVPKPDVAQQQVEDAAAQAPEVAAATPNRTPVESYQPPAESAPQPASGAPPSSVTENAGAPPSSVAENAGAPPSSVAETAGAPPSSVAENAGAPPSTVAENVAAPPSTVAENMAAPPSTVAENAGAPPSTVAENVAAPPTAADLAAAAPRSGFTPPASGAEGIPAGQPAEISQPVETVSQEFHPGEPEPIGYWELPDSVRAEVPEIKFSVLVYTTKPSDRFVLINGQRLAEGDTAQPGLVVKEIRRDGVVFSFRLYQFLVER